MTSPVHQPVIQDSLSCNLSLTSSSEERIAQTHHRSVKTMLSYAYNKLKDFLACINPVNIYNRKAKEREERNYILFGQNEQQQDEDYVMVGDIFSTYTMVTHEDAMAECIDEAAYDIITPNNEQGRK